MLTLIQSPGEIVLGVAGGTLIIGEAFSACVDEWTIVGHARFFKGGFYHPVSLLL